MSTSNVEAVSRDTTVLFISGMTCSGCVSTVIRLLTRVPGVVDATVDLVSGEARVAGSACPADLVGAVRAAGYEVRLADGGGETN